MENHDFGTLMIAIKNRFTSSPSNYPILSSLNTEERLAFLINHSVLHMGKVMGILSTECEAHGHGKPVITDRLQDAAAKMFINTIKLAADLGMTPELLLTKSQQMIQYYS